MRPITEPSPGRIDSPMKRIAAAPALALALSAFSVLLVSPPPAQAAGGASGS
jgi:hypothetical protein